MPELRSQQGSVLVTVLGLSIALSLAAGSLLLVAANSQNTEDMAFQRQRCFNDAESGLMLGAAWLKRVPSNGTVITTDQHWTGPGNTLTLFNNFPMDNGSSLTLTLRDNVPNGQQTKTIVSKAVLGDVNFQLSWDVWAATTGGPSNNGIDADGTNLLTLKNRRPP
jgi:Tfp pilus assembly protein PilX